MCLIQVAQLPVFISHLSCSVISHPAFDAIQFLPAPSFLEQFNVYIRAHIKTYNSLVLNPRQVFMQSGVYSSSA